MKIEIVRLRTEAILPEYQTHGAAGMDVCACLDEAVTLQPGERRMIPSGFAIAVPEGYEAQIRARSGLSIKYGLTLINGIGTIDADYRGEVGVLLVNLGQVAVEITSGMRIAQMVIAKYERVLLEEVVSLEETLRGSGGFGSTGK